MHTLASYLTQYKFPLCFAAAGFVNDDFCFVAILLVQLCILSAIAETATAVIPVQVL